MARFSAIAAGFLVSVSVPFLIFVTAEITFLILRYEGTWGAVLWAGLFLLIFLIPIVAIVVLLPFCLAVMVAEFLSIRTPVYYAIAGGLTAILCAMPLGLSRDIQEGQGDLLVFPPESGVVQFILGAIAGLAYWVMSGKYAGRREPISPAPSGS